MRHLNRIFEAQSVDFRAVDFDDKTEIERYNEEIAPAEREIIASWLRGIGIEEDEEKWGGFLPEDNYMVFTRAYSLSEEIRMNVEVIKLQDDEWALRVDRVCWDSRMDDYVPQGSDDRAYRCDDMRGLKAALDATVRKLADEYLRVERLFDAARAEEARMDHLEKALDQVPRSNRRKR